MYALKRFVLSVFGRTFFGEGLNIKQDWLLLLHQRRKSNLVDLTMPYF